mgnify:CR=1 FL=1
MEDNQIIELYWNKNEKAISETDKKYGKYCNYIAYNILQNAEDSNEWVNDTYLRTWNTIPPQRPTVFKLFIAKITRNLAIDKYRKNKHKSIMEEVLDELKDCTTNESVENEVEYSELLKNINIFLDNLSIDKRRIFIDRYWSFDSIENISNKYELKKGNIKMILSRTRKDLKEYLKGVDLLWTM